VKFTAYILIVVLFLASAGTALFYFPELGAIRQDMQRQIEKKDKQIEFTFSQNVYTRLNWTRPGKEFRYHGKMYDVASVKTAGEKVSVVCLFDKEETGLREKLKDFFSSGQGKDNPLHHAVKTLSQKYVLSVPVFTLPVRSLLAAVFTPYYFPATDILHGPPPPPPQF